MSEAEDENLQFEVLPRDRTILSPEQAEWRGSFGEGPRFIFCIFEKH